MPPRASHSHPRPQRSPSSSSSVSSRSSASSSNSSPRPPSYLPDQPLNPPPVYNPRPAPNEDTILAGALPPPDNVYTHRSKQITVALSGQERAVDAGDNDNPENRPVYGKGATIAGVVELKEEGGLKLADVLHVKLTIQGKLKLEIAEGGQTSQLFLDHSILLHSSQPPSNDPTPSRPCPSLLSFAYTLPLTFDEDSPQIGDEPPPPGPVHRQLPPTYLVQYDGIPGIRAEVRYSITVQVERKRFWNIKKKHNIRIYFIYVPRNRPHIPGPSPFASFIAAVKHTPEEWAAFINDVPRRTDPTGREIQHSQDTALKDGNTITSSLVLPSTQTFPLTQAIPFHLQLSVSSPSSVTAPASREQPSRFPRRPKTAPPLGSQRTDISNTKGNLLSLFSDPEFTAPPVRGRKRANTTNALVGVGEGIAGDGAMYGDPRYANTGRGNLEVPRPEDPAGRRPSTSPVGRHYLTNEEDEARKKSYVRVFLQRQVVVTVKGQKVVKTIACGDGRLHRVRLDNPPAFGEHLYDGLDLIHRSQHGPPIAKSGGIDGVDHIGWEGYVIPSRDVLAVGGFRTNGLWVKDFITLTMIPPDPEHSPLRALHHAVPVKLVSDPWEEEWWTGRRM